MDERIQEIQDLAEQAAGLRKLRESGGFEKAAVLLDSLCQNRPFVDGNKRTACTAAGLFLQENGWRLEAETEDAVGFMLQVAGGKRHKEEIRIWLEEHSVPHGKSG